MNRVNWDLHYDDPPAFQHDLENQMNMVAGATTAGPHGPQVIPGVYTLKLTVDGQVYTQHVTVMNDPRVGQSPELMAALRAQNQLTMLAYHGMQQSYQGNRRSDTVRTQLASLMQSNLPGDVATQAKTLDASLTKIGGEMPASPAPSSARPTPKPDALQSFVTLNNDYNTMVSMMQVGLDMAPTPTQIATWESDCSNYNRTVDAWNGDAEATHRQLQRCAGQRPTCRSLTSRPPSSLARRAALRPARTNQEVKYITLLRRTQSVRPRCGIW